MADIKIKRTKLHDDCILIVSLEIMTHSYPQKIGGDSLYEFHSDFYVVYLYFLSLTANLIAARVTRSIVFAWQINFTCFIFYFFSYTLKIRPGEHFVFVMISGDNYYVLL